MCTLQILSAAKLELWGRLRQMGRSVEGVAVNLISGGRLESRQRNCVSYGIAPLFQVGSAMRDSIPELKPIQELLPNPKKNKQRDRPRRQERQALTLGQQSVALSHTEVDVLGPSSRSSHSQALEQMGLMGFVREEAQAALELSQGDVSKAIELLAAESVAEAHRTEARPTTFTFNAHAPVFEFKQ